MNKRELKQYAVFSGFAIAVCLIVQNFSFLGKVIGIGINAIQPMLFGFVIAYIFNIIMSAFEKGYLPRSESKAAKLTRRPVCILLAFAVVIMIIALVLYIVIPEVMSAMSLLFSAVPPLLEKAGDYAVSVFKEYPEIQDEVEELVSEFDFKSLDWATITEKATGFIQTGVLGIISSAVGILGAVTGTITNIVLALIFAIYLLSRKDKLKVDIGRFMNAYIGEKANRNISRIARTADETFRNFFIGQFVEAIIIGSLCFIGMTILRLPYAAMTGVVVGVTALIPVVGAFLGAGIGAFLISTVNPKQALIFLVFLVVLQQFETNIIYPKVVGESVGLPGMWVLASITVGGGIFGVVGMLVSVPFAATLYRLCFEDLKTKEKNMGIALPEEKEAAEKKKKAPKTEVKKQEKNVKKTTPNNQKTKKK